MNDDLILRVAEAIISRLNLGDSMETQYQVQEWLMSRCYAPWELKSTEAIVDEYESDHRQAKTT